MHSTSKLTAGSRGLIAAADSERAPANVVIADAGAATTASRSGGTVDAPGKTHRKRAPSTRGVKHSDQTISKIAGAKMMRRGDRRG